MCGRSSEGRNSGAGFGSGWDIIAPSGWGAPLFLALALSTARVGGVMDKKHCQLEMTRPHEPDDLPDTVAGQQHAAQVAEQLQLAHYRRPPAKRCNFAKNGFSSPFRTDWDAILSSYGCTVCQPCCVAGWWSFISPLPGTSARGAG